MATSGTFAFSLDLGQVLEEAFEQAGEELRTGYNYRTARRSLNLLLLEWQNRGLNLWTVKNASETLISGTSSYTLTGEKLDIVEAVLRTDAGDTAKQTDLHMTRMSVATYARQTNKLTTGRPIKFYVERTPAGINLVVWPTPDGTTTYTINYYYMEQIEDVTGNADQDIDIPSRHLPALVAGLAFKVAAKYKKFDLLPHLESQYEKQLGLASDASREKASWLLRPRIAR